MSRAEFTILDTYTGKQDSFVLSNCLLSDRIKTIFSQNKAKLEEINKQRKLKKMPALIEDLRPTIPDLEETHKFYLSTIFKPYVAHSYSYFQIGNLGGSSIALANSDSTNTVKFELNNNPGTFWHDMVLHIIIDAIDGGTTTKYKYCDFPGMRVCKNFKLHTNGLPIDEYSQNELIYFYNFNISSDKRPAFNKCMGQEELQYGEFYNSSYGGVKQAFAYYDGPQTPKFVQPQLELFIPLLFWFNLRYDNCLIKNASASQQTYFEIDLDRLSNLVQATDVNGVPIPLTLQKVNITKCALYTRNFFVEPIVQDLFAGKKFMSIARVHKLQTKQLITENDQIKLSEIKYLVEQLQFGFRPLANNASFTHWYKFSQIADREYPESVVIYNPLVFPVNQLVVRTSVIRKTVPIVQTISFYIHENYLYKEFSSAFFNNYTPYSAVDTISPPDIGAYLISFNLNNQLQPSGYLNVSRARESYIEYKNSSINASNPTEFIAYAKCMAIIEYLGTSVLIKYII